MDKVIKLPVTDVGRAFLRQSLQSGWYHNEVAHRKLGPPLDWDEVAEQAEADWESYQRFLLDGAQ